ncbi:hypothetical protein AN639_01680 [Candidatus Epulonipiscium fishelsonii]|uniref:Uncharacterized protein n=1 Tax=Candidatus Epulonipiscium fishelsonii TaxID=77094 RepID=A0ACC8XE05_9FIRM|nr:hypothetical protein AN639_01680 [Epulopiscium sp. SCG-B05WGA-EpuloA1]ONI41215.1 hypothetical protein AN396_03760 [Epulopiscium sp. SCG-B11WGA-EpuloA1]
MVINNYYNITSCYGAKWSKDEGFYYISNKSGVNQIWHKDKEGNETQITFFTERIFSLNMTPNKQDILFTMDAGGNEQEQIYMINNSKIIDITQNSSARHQYGGMKPDGKTIVFASNARNPKNFDICEMNIDTKEVKIIIQNEDSYNIPAELSPCGNYLLYNKLKAQSDNCLWIANLQTQQAKNIDPTSENAMYVSPAWKKNSQGFYFLTDKGSDFEYLAYYDMQTGKIIKVYEEKWGIEKIKLSYDDKYLAMQINRDGYSEIEILNTTTNKLISIPSAPKGVMNYFGMNWDSNSYKLLFSVTTGTRPTNVWLLDLENDLIKKVTTASLEGINKDLLAEPTLHHYKSFDDLVVPFWVYKQTSEVSPVIIDIHGGPEAQGRPMFSPLTQYLISQGFTIVAPNVRGSTGYGKAYTYLDDIEKRLDSVKDIESLVKYLVNNNMAPKDKIAVMGASYGGYMTLACVANYPDLFAAGVDTVGMSNLETFLENTAEYRRSHRETEYGSLEHHRDILRKVSPIHKVDEIIAPLMVIHGANDPRVPVSEAEQIVQSLKDRNVPVEYLRYEDEGHGLSKRKNQLDCYPKVVEFLNKHLNK